MIHLDLSLTLRLTFTNNVNNNETYYIRWLGIRSVFVNVHFSYSFVCVCWLFRLVPICPQLCAFPSYIRDYSRLAYMKPTGELAMSNYGLALSDCILFVCKCLTPFLICPHIYTKGTNTQQQWSTQCLMFEITHIYQIYTAAAGWTLLHFYIRFVFEWIFFFTNKMVKWKFTRVSFFIIILS